MHFCTELSEVWVELVVVHVCLHYEALEQYYAQFFITYVSVSHPLISCSVIVFPTVPGCLHNCGFSTAAPHTHQQPNTFVVFSH